MCSKPNKDLQKESIYDVVLTGGRVIDPETKLDTIKNVGIIENRIAAISIEPLKGKQEVNVEGLVVAPGFIDLHVHGRSNQEQEYQVHDGVTTALELEWGIEFLEEWYATRKSKALINYGASVCWPFERFKALDKYEEGLGDLLEQTRAGESYIWNLFEVIRPSYDDTLSSESTDRMLTHIKKSLEEGGIGIGVPIGYLPQTDPDEMFRVFKLAGELDALVYSHVRQPNIGAIQEVIANATITGAPLHIVHINSMALGKIELALNMVENAQNRGFDITAELYPYTAGSTGIETAVFNEGWQGKLGIDYGDLQWVATGERLTEESFNAYRKSGGMLILHMMKPEWIQLGIANPNTIVASDGMPYAPLAHPRTAGTFSRLLGKYVREEKVVDLTTALEKITLLPAKRLEDIAPMMRSKGRIQLGADADITIFDPEKIIDKSTFEAGLEFSEGVQFVLVNGAFVIKDGNIVPNNYPGQPVYGKFKK
jgi:N-acyl-D-aspartate/D-glutamate deacylase